MRSKVYRDGRLKRTQLVRMPFDCGFAISFLCYKMVTCDKNRN